MPSFETTIIDAKKQTSDTITLRFGTGGKNFEFKAGQYIMLAIGQNLTKPLSICCSPTKKDFIEITKKITESEFSKKIASAKKGDTVKIAGPFGKFVFEESAQNIAMLCGGIGITPLRSMIQYATDKKLSNKITLFYSNKNPKEIAFFDELKELQKENKNFKVIFTVTQAQENQKNWDGHIGRIDKELITKHTQNCNEAIFYSCGPPSMVEAMKQILLELNVSAEKIRTELFTGYK